MITFINNNDGTTTITNFASDTSKQCIVDTEDVEKINNLASSWYYHKKRGYVFTTLRGFIKNGKLNPRNEYHTNGKKQQTIMLHNFLMNTPTGFDTDHINGDKLQNTKSNLRVVTHAENLSNSYRHRNEEWIKKQEQKLLQKRVTKNIYPYTNKRLKKTYLFVRYHGLTKYCNTQLEAEETLKTFKEMIAAQKTQNTQNKD